MASTGSKQRIRQANFTASEEELLLKIIEDKRDIVENKKTDAVTWEQKNKAWNEISELFEALSGTKRPTKNLRDKYENMKKKVKKNVAEEKKEIFLTGGGSKRTIKQGENTETLLRLMGTSAVGLENQYDGDAIGSYQPSHELMLRFYAYYKQATEGPCTAPRPSFWEVVKKMKWEAWTKLGNMSKEEAMNNYVEELKKIVETMSYTDNVANFLGSLGSFYDSVPVEDLELLVGNVIERMRSQPGSPLSGSPFASREASPNRIQATTNGHHLTSSLETSPASSYSPSPQLDELEEDDDEEFIDSIEAEPDSSSKEAPLKLSTKSTTINDMVNGSDSSYSDQPSVVTNGYRKKASSLKVRHTYDSIEPACQNGRASYQERGRSRERNNPRPNQQTDDQCIPETTEETLQMLLEPLEITDKIRTAVVQLQKDLSNICVRMDNMEHAVSTFRSQASHNTPTWWPFPQVPPGFAAFVIMWPVVFHLAVLWLQRRRQRRLL